MKFLRVLQNDIEFLLNIDLIASVKKGEEKEEFIILMKTEAFPLSFKVFGESGRFCEKILAVKKLLDGKE